MTNTNDVQALAREILVHRNISPADAIEAAKGFVELNKIQREGAAQSGGVGLGDWKRVRRTEFAEEWKLELGDSGLFLHVWDDSSDPADDDTGHGQWSWALMDDQDNTIIEAESDRLVTKDTALEDMRKQLRPFAESLLAAVS
jgi:hypothetical protein